VIREEMVDADQDADTGPVDFGELLKSVSDQVSALHEEMVALEAPTTTDLETLKTKLEDIQKGDMARLCESGPRVQQRYGQAVFAEIFSPLSAAERKLNRMWATLVDQHWPEALASAEGAHLGLQEALTALTAHASD